MKTKNFSGSGIRFGLGGASWLAMMISLSAYAAPMPTAATIDEHLRVGVRPWFSQGSDMWQISFGGFDPDFGDIQGRSKLKWKNLDATVPVVYGELALCSWLSIAGSYGSADISDGDSTDTDWLDAPDAGVHSKISESTADTEGQTRFYNIDACFRMNPEAYFPRTKGRLDLILGYQHYEDDLRDQKGMQTILDDSPVSFPLDGLNSTFDFKWDAARIGLREHYPLHRMVYLNADATGLLVASYKGDGFWNLRDDMSSHDPNFTQEADMGYGADLRLALEFRPIRYLSVDAGYRWFMLDVTDGTETTFYADGTASTEKLDEVQSIRQGFFAGVQASF